MISQSSNTCVSTEEFYEGGYECPGIWEEAVMDYLKGAMQGFVGEDNKTVEVLRKFLSTGIGTGVYGTQVSTPTCSEIKE